MAPQERGRTRVPEKVSHAGHVQKFFPSSLFFYFLPYNQKNGGAGKRNSTLRPALVLSSLVRPCRVLGELRVRGLQDEFVWQVVDLIVRIHHGNQGQRQGSEKFSHRGNEKFLL